MTSRFEQRECAPPVIGAGVVGAGVGTGVAESDGTRDRWCYTRRVVSRSIDVVECGDNDPSF